MAPAPGTISARLRAAWTSREVRLGALVFVAALAIRIGYVLESHADPALRHPLPGLDAQITWEAARVLGGDLAPQLEPKMLSAPLHMVWVWLHQRILGGSLERQRLAAACWGALRILLIFVLVRRVTGRSWPAAVVGLLQAGLPSLVYFDTVLLKTSLDLLLLTLLLVALLVWRPPVTRRGAAARGIACGALLGLALLSQMATLLYLLPVVAALALVPGWRRLHRVGAITVAGLVLAAVLGGWQLRGRDGAGPALCLPREGVDLRMGFAPGNRGIYLPLPGMSNNLVGHALEARLLAEQEEGRRLTWAEANAVHRRAALGQIARDPVAAARLVGRKLELLVADFEIKSEDHLESLQARSLILRSPVSFGWLFVLGVLGAVELARERRWHLLVLLLGLAACVAVSCSLTFVNWRFRLPLVVPLSILAGPGILGMARMAAELARRREPRRARWWWPAVATLLPIVAAAWITFRPPPGISREELLARAAVVRAASVRAAGDEARLAELDARARRGPPPRQERIERLLLLVALERHSQAFAAARALTADGVADPAVVAVELRYLIWLDRYEEAARLLDRTGAAAPVEPGSRRPAQDQLVQRTVSRFVAPLRDGRPAAPP